MLESLVFVIYKIKSFEIEKIVNWMLIIFVGIIGLLKLEGYYNFNEYIVFL